MPCQIPTKNKNRFFIYYIFAQNFYNVMNQPELGRKIVELRKAKGLTQDELVAICNLSVRTLQRIESGEVMPRSFTIKAIFFALDYNIYETTQLSPENEDSMGVATTNWLEQIYRYVFDLFNLKTNTMKKLLILSAITICGIFLFTGITNAQSVKSSKIIGTWQLCNALGEIINTGQCEFKIIKPSSFVVYRLNKDSSTFVSLFQGQYTYKDSIYVEKIDFTNRQLKSYKGVQHEFKIKFKDDLMYIVGINNSYNQIWKRIEK